MQNTRTRYWSLALFALCLNLATSAFADLLYDNSSQRVYPYRFEQTDYEFGEEIILAGANSGSWTITNFQYEFFAEGPDLSQ